ncbi:NAD(+) diphosphatase [Motiliproteus sediminis]|uniref:NAD(+) diphosphatase n=1 Tax=Motiliproteus sediminis TaxID=1468178 RepID=UPI001AEFEAF1|nr:NAD(+) diphosphatase [Motiliproteus sediminis]
MTSERYLWFVGDRLVVDAEGNYLHDQPAEQARFTLPVSRAGDDPALWLCSLDSDGPVTPSCRSESLRALLGNADEGEFARLSRAAQLNTWHRHHRFCSRCGAPTRLHNDDLAAHCDQCNYAQYPRISPCIIVLIRDGERCLLAHAAHYGPGRYSTLAGFIEAGETAEEAVRREVKEEVGVDVDNVRYAFSQSWPFPHALMLGFYADYAGGEITPDGVEILDAQWFGKQPLPDLPPPFTISRRLIDGFLASLD